MSFLRELEINISWPDLKKDFFNKIFEEKSPFHGATVSYPCFGPLVTSAMGFKSQGGSLFAWFLTCVILRFTSGATPTDCMEILVSLSVLENDTGVFPFEKPMTPIKVKDRLMCHGPSERMIVHKQLKVMSIYKDYQFFSKNHTVKVLKA